MGEPDRRQQPVQRGRVLIGPANLRDFTYIGANLREADRREIFCQLPEGTTGSGMAAQVFDGLAGDWTWIASIDGQPVCAFGFQPFTTPVWIGWAWGTRQMVRAIPAVTRHCLEQEMKLIGLGVRRLEVRTIKGHDVSHLWLSRLGCRYRCDLPDHGRNGETFELWAWQLSDGLPTVNTSYRNNRHVHAETSEAPEASAAPVAAEQDGG